MPSPFPGMDPWLEDPEIFPDFHERFTTYVSDAIQERLPPHYYTALGRRTWIEFSRRYIGPDVHVSRAALPEPQGGAAVALEYGNAKLIRVAHDVRKEVFVEIYTGRKQDKRLVTSIEILSWANKTPGQHGRDLYIRKQNEVLESQVHLVEIDLLRGGTHTTAVPRDIAVQAAGEFDYHVLVHQFTSVEDFLLFPIRLEDRLPDIPIPLLPGDAAVPLSLQAVFDRCYDAGPYAREIDYREDVPVPALRSEQAEWARGRLAPSAS